MTDKLPPNLLALFAPRPPLRWVEAPDHAPERRMTRRVDGVAQFLPALEAYKRTDFPEPTESWLEAKDRKLREKKDAILQNLSDGPTSCTSPDPAVVNCPADDLPCR
jgi:U1 small nuclear ribonucleoprotein 70kDa